MLTVYLLGVGSGVVVMLWVDRVIIRGVHRALSRFL
jgi:hypothetical protein